MDADVPPLRSIPSVDRILRELDGQFDVPRDALAAVVRRELAAIRVERSASNGSVLERVRDAIDNLRCTRIRPVINGTGIIIHTNLGRSPMGDRVAQAVLTAATRYSSIEYDLTGGRRGGRAAYLEHNLAALCGAEAAAVVNNCAAALLLVLRHFTTRSTARDHVIISRGELVQIGGGFRIPEILQASSAVLREVGTTNKTTPDDYRSALDDRTAMILKVHQSNFFMDGFVESVAVSELSAIARQGGIPLIADLGSGATFDTSALGGGEREPTPPETLAAGADLVTFSGDKLLGGPQAGIIAGSAAHVAALKKNPFFRALRCDKLILAALQETVDLLLADRTDQIPIRAMMQVSIDALRTRAQGIIERVGSSQLSFSIEPSESRIGGGSLPRTTIPSIAIVITTRDGVSPEELARRLRQRTPPIIGHIARGAFRIDLRTVREDEGGQIVAALRATTS